MDANLLKKLSFIPKTKLGLKITDFLKFKIFFSPCSLDFIYFDLFFLLTPRALMCINLFILNCSQKEDNKAGNLECISSNF